MKAPDPVVYRVYDRSGRLIYIGASINLANRLKTHHSQSWWYGLVDRVESEPHPTAKAALSAEASAIRSEQPAFNVTHTGTPSWRWRMTKDDAQVCREWRRSKCGVVALPTYLRRALARAS